MAIVPLEQSTACPEITPTSTTAGMMERMRRGEVNGSRGGGG